MKKILIILQSFIMLKKKERHRCKNYFQIKKYISVLEKYIQNKLLSENEEQFNILKRSFSNLSENDFSLYYDSGLDTDTEPHFFSVVK